MNVVALAPVPLFVSLFRAPSRLTLDFPYDVSTHWCLSFPSPPSGLSFSKFLFFVLYFNCAFIGESPNFCSPNYVQHLTTGLPTLSFSAFSSNLQSSSLLVPPLFSRFVSSSSLNIFCFTCIACVHMSCYFLLVFLFFGSFLSCSLLLQPHSHNCP